MGDPDDLRYGVFLVPDARTSAAITDITGYLQAQFGLVSAGRFPPHVTLEGTSGHRSAGMTEIDSFGEDGVGPASSMPWAEIGGRDLDVRPACRQARRELGV